MSQYSFKIYNRTEDEAWELPYTRMSLTEELNKGLDGSLSMPYASINKYAQKLGTTVDGILSAGFRSWRLYKDTHLMYRGVLSHRTIEGANTGPSTVVVYFTDYIGMLGSRYTPEEDLYTNEDSSDIAWSIIDDSQNDASTHGDLGITRGSNPTTKNRNRTFRHANIRDSLIGMSQAKVADGYDFDIDNTLQFNVYYPSKGQSRPEIMFSDFNVLSWSSNRPLTTKLFNRVHVLGEGLGADLTAVTRENTTPMATWGLVEATLPEKSVSNTTELEDRGDRFLERTAEIRDTLNINTLDDRPGIDQYGLGDSVRVVIDSLGLDEMLRLDTRTLQITPSGFAQVSLTFQEREINPSLVEMIKDQNRQIADLERY